MKRSPKIRHKEKDIIETEIYMKDFLARYFHNCTVFKGGFF